MKRASKGKMADRLSRIGHMLTDNLALKLIALAISFFIWLFVSNSDDPTRSRLYSNVPITIINEDSIADVGKVVEVEGSGTVTLKVTERRSVLSSLSVAAGDFYVEADLETINDMGMVPLTVSCSNSQVTWDEISVSPTALKVTIEDMVEQAFPVTVTTSGSVASGYAVGTTEIAEGKTILIAGPSSLIKIIGTVTAPVSVSGLNSDTTLTSGLRIYDKNGAEFTDTQVSRLELKDSEGNELTDGRVEVKIAMWEVDSDVTIEAATEGRPAAGYSIAGITTLPATISVAGTSEALEELGGVLQVNETISVAGASENVTQEIDLTQTLAERSDLKLLTDADPVISVTVSIEKNGDTIIDIPLSAITLENRPSDMRLVFTPADKISIGVHTDDDSEVTLTSEDITASMDLSACAEEGTYEIPVDIEMPEGYEMSSSVTVKVSSSPTETSAFTSGEESAEPATEDN